MRHHNRSRLIALTDQGLNPNKKYVAGKNGSLVEEKPSIKVLSKKEEKAVVVTASTPEKETSAKPSSPIEVHSTKEETKTEENLSVVESPEPLEVVAPPEQTVEFSPPVEPEVILPKEDKTLKKKKSFSITP